ncbi:MAG: hypothetical protein IT578_00455 [Verrucomicrobiae bacterium]|nr:hypothetical protein [Verrucomicrobiae bacterium]
MFILSVVAAWHAWRTEMLALWRQQEAELARDLDHLARRNRAMRERLEREHAAKTAPQIFALIEETMSEIRGLPLKRPMAYRSTSRRMLREEIAARMSAQYGDDALRDYQSALVRMRLLPDGIHLSGMIVELLSEQIAAFYDTESHELRVFEGLNLNRASERMIVAHETIHALQDQNFNLAALALRHKGHDDLTLAAAALVEGDANYHMRVYQRARFRARNLLEDLGFLFSRQMGKLLSAPEFLRQTLLFPYQEGQKFVAALYASGGVEAVNRAYAHPPQSTEQVLHPEKYLSGNDPPKPVAVDLAPGVGWRWLHENTVGELGLRAFFTPLLGVERAARVAEGWGGDRYVVYDVRTPAGGWVLVWKTVWDTPADAHEFFDAMEADFRDRFGAPETEKAATAKRASSAALFYSFASQKQALVLREDAVILMDAPDSATLRGVMARAAGDPMPAPAVGRKPPL